MKERTTNKRYYLITFIIVAVFIVGIITVQRIATDYAAVKLNERLKQMLPQNYALHYDRINISLINKEIYVSNLLVQPDSNFASSDIERAYELDLPIFDLKLRSIFDILLYKELIITDINIISPKVVIRTFSSSNSTTITRESNNILEVLSKYLDIFEIESLSIQNAGFQLHHGYANERDGFTVKDINLFLKDFMVDSTASKNNFLNAREIELVINKEAYYLPDNIHQIAFDQFRLSTKDSILSFSNLKFSPVVDSVFQDTSVSNHHDLYDFQIPNFSINGIAYSNSYLNEELGIGKILLDQPEFLFKEKLIKTIKDTSENTNPLQSLISTFAPSLEISEIELRDADFNVELSSLEGRQFIFTIDSFSLFDCQLDPENLYFDKFNQPFQNFKIYASNLQEEVPNIGHQFSSNQFIIDSEQKLIDIQGMKLEPISNKIDSSQLRISQEVAQLNIQGIDIIGWMYGDKIDLDKISLLSPKINVQIPQKTDTTRQKEANVDVEVIRQLFKNPLIDEIKSRSLVIEKGVLEINDNIQVDQFDFKVNRLKLNQYIPNWKALAGSFSIDLRGINFQEDQIKVQLGKLQTDGQTHLLKNIKVATPLEDYNNNLNIGQLTIYNTDLDSLLSKVYYADSILLSDLKIDGILPAPKGPKRKGPPPPLPFTTPVLKINNGQVNLQLAREEKIAIKKLNANLQINKTIELKELLLKDIEFKAPQQSHYLLVDQIQALDTLYSFALNDLMWMPKSDTFKQMYLTNIPKVIIERWNKEEWMDSGNICMDVLLMENPFLSLVSHGQGNKKEAQTASTSIKLPPINIKQIELTNGIFQTELKNPNQQLTFSLPDYDLLFTNFDSRNFSGNFSDVPNLYDKLLFSSNVPLNFKLNDQELNAAHLYMDLKLGNFVLGNFELTTQDSLNPYHVKSNQLLVEEFDIEKWLKEEKIEAQKVLIGSSELELELQVKDEKNQNENAPFDPEQALLKNIPDIAIDDLQIEKTAIKIAHKTPITINGFQLKSNEVKLDTTLNLASINSYYKSLELGWDYFKMITGTHKEYELTHALRYNSEQEQLNIQRFRLYPLYDQYEYTHLLDTQADYFNIAIPEMTFHQFEWQQLFQPTIELNKLAVSDFKAKIFRDQNIPHPELAVPLIQQQIKDIPYPFSLDTLLLNGDINFSILPKDAEETAIINFNKLEGSLTNISNQAERWESPMFLDARCQLFENIPIDATVNFNMKDALNGFRMKGDIGYMDITDMNQILTPTARIFIKSGYNRSITFEISANDEIAIGDMYFKYNKLKFRIVDKDDFTHTSLGNSILSFWANRLVKSNNPSFLRKRKGIIYYERNKKRAIFNYWSRSFLSGIISSIGVKNNKKKLKKIGIKELEAVDYQEIFEKGLKVKN